MIRTNEGQRKSIRSQDSRFSFASTSNENVSRLKNEGQRKSIRSQDSRFSFASASNENVSRLKNEGQRKSIRSQDSRFSFASTSNENVSRLKNSQNSTTKKRASSLDSIFCCFGYKFDEPSNPPLPYLDISDASFETNKSEINRNLIKKPSFEIISTHIKFTLDEIVEATNNFSIQFLIGEGGSGVVYKGQLPNGTYVAVKRAKKNIQDSLTRETFRNEIETLQRIQHLNLVSLYGYLEYETEQIIVVEYVPNGNLRQHLDCFFGNFLDFGSRLDIAIDIAHAITYLHTYCDKPIIHRDIKSTNILITNTLHAKVTDFGFSRFGPNEDGETHIQTKVKGTAGYLDPDYFKTSFLTEKSDVYSFGVLLVEILTGRRPIEPRKGKERITAEWAMEEFAKGNAASTLDPKLTLINMAINLTIEQMYELASQCLSSTRQNRPSMKTCAEILWGIRKSYLDLSTSERKSLQGKAPISRGNMER